MRGASSAMSLKRNSRRSWRAAGFFIAFIMKSTHILRWRGMPRQASSPFTRCGRMLQSSPRGSWTVSGSTSGGSTSSDFEGPHPMRSPTFLYRGGAALIVAATFTGGPCMY